jgi:serine/threonine-protein kinase
LQRAERPAILSTAKGMLVTWVDDHEVKDRDHVYGALLDPTGKSLGPIRDLTPEANSAQRPQLIAGGADRPILLWWDSGKGPEAGVHVRFLDADGRIDTQQGKSVKVGPTKPGDYWPVIEKSREGFIVAWQDDRDNREKEWDIFVRRLSSELETVGPETRLTDFHAAKSPKGPPRAKLPAIAVAPSTLFVAMRLEEAPNKHYVMRLRVPLEDIEKPNPGLPESRDPNRSSRQLGEMAPINEDKFGDAPSLACGKEGCFAAWHGEPGVWVAFIDASGGNPQWKKQISVKGGHPSLGVNNGQVAVAYYDAGRLKMALLSREGVASASTLYRMTDVDRPRPSLAAGADPTEWALAWQDSDVEKKGPAEIYAARISCK